MAKKLPEQVFAEILDVTASNLALRGFRRRGKAFRLLDQGNCGIIDFQRSVTSSSEKIKFTINLGIICGELRDSSLPGVDKAAIIDAHLRERIGALFSDGQDKWWEANPDRAPEAQEVADLVLTYGVPYIETHVSTAALIALWESGPAPGLTALQRDRYLSKLKATRFR